MGWLIGGVWIGAVVLAAVVLAFCAYEVSWKSRRLAADLERLTSLGTNLAEVQAQVDDLTRRVSTPAV